MGDGAGIAIQRRIVRVCTDSYFCADLTAVNHDLNAAEVDHLLAQFVWRDIALLDLDSGTGLSVLFD